MNNTEFFSEADVINVIGYKTPMEFIYASDGTFSFKTQIPQGDELIYYEVDFFVDENTPPSFFRVDSFDDFLSKYQIFKVTKKSNWGDIPDEVLFLRKYESEK